MLCGISIGGGGSPDVGRTWPDVVAQHAGFGAVVATLVAGLVVVGVGAVIVWRSGARARAEGREFAALWGLVSIGPRAATTSDRPPELPSADTSGPHATSSGSHLAAGLPHISSVPPPDVVQRGVLAINRAAHEIAMARPDQVEEREMYLLIAILKASAQALGVTRRASILKVHRGPDGDPVMKLHMGTPEALFHKPYASFSKRAHTEEGQGLCWAAVHACQGGFEQDSIRRFIFYAPDVAREPSFVPIKGHHPFKAILVAPIVHERNREVLGVLCLDSDSTDHYTDADRHIVAIAALALSVAWKARQNAS